MLFFGKLIINFYLFFYIYDIRLSKRNIAKISIVGHRKEMDLEVYQYMIDDNVNMNAVAW